MKTIKVIPFNQAQDSAYHLMGTHPCEHLCMFASANGCANNRWKMAGVGSTCLDYKNQLTNSAPMWAWYFVEEEVAALRSEES